jgi:hypothetical protein
MAIFSCVLVYAVCSAISLRDIELITCKVASFVSEAHPPSPEFNDEDFALIGDCTLASYSHRERIQFFDLCHSVAIC